MNLVSVIDRRIRLKAQHLRQQHLFLLRVMFHSICRYQKAHLSDGKQIPQTILFVCRELWGYRLGLVRFCRPGQRAMVDVDFAEDLLDVAALVDPDAIVVLSRTT
jgi:hypothetical protein